ncbi:MAG: right-handed parallel beta-helix repeat-containing protein, partial [Nanoarchaeota archaeon]|nr:right-handed parallel beta-helix repeat-containing protein [Nanoarchaeota archaeon]
IDSTDAKINSDYFQRLAPKAIQYGAGVIRLFVADAEYEANKLSRQKNSSQQAQVFSPSNELGTNSSDYKPQNLPEIKPSRLPESLTIKINSPVDLPTVAPSGAEEGTPSNPLEQVPIETPSQEQENKEIKAEEQNGVQGEIQGNQGVSYQGDGGLSQGIIDQINSNPPAGGQNLDEQIVSESEPELEPELPSPPVILPHLVINEIQVRDNEFVELYNPTSASIDLTGYYFSYYPSARDWNDPNRNQEFLASASVPANGYYLIGFEGYLASSGNPKSDWQIYDSQQLNNTNGSIAIFDFDPKSKIASESKAGAIDVVAWGNVDFVKEGTAFQSILGQDKSMQRMNFADNDDNNTDFEYKKIPSSTNSLGEGVVAGTTIYDHTIISTDTTWTIAGSPYYLESNFNQWPIVASGSILTIEPGVVIMPQNSNYTSLEIRGTLKAEGTAIDKIVFTSKNDSDYGGGGGMQSGDWKNIVFTSSSNNSILKNVIFRYGGAKEGLNQIETEMVKIDNGSVKMENVLMEKSLTRCLHLINSGSVISNTTFKECKVGVLIEGVSDISKIENSIFENNLEHGLQVVDNAAPIISNNQFNNNGQVGINTKYPKQGAIVIYSAYPQFSNNSLNNNLLNGALVDYRSMFSRDLAWNDDMPYIIMSSAGEFVTINQDVTLTIAPSTIIKLMGSHTPLLVKGIIMAKAESGSEIVFTSIYDDTLYDDTFGGDTNNDGKLTTPRSNDWKKIKFDSTSIGSVFDHVFMYYGTGTPPMDINASASVDIRDTVDYSP